MPVALVTPALGGCTMDRPLGGHAVFVSQPGAVLRHDAREYVDREFARQCYDDGPGHDRVLAPLGPLAGLPVHRSHNAGGKHVASIARVVAALARALVGAGVAPDVRGAEHR